MVLTFLRLVFCFFFKQKAAYEMRISDWSSDVCSSDLVPPDHLRWICHCCGSCCLPRWSCLCAGSSAGQFGRADQGAGRRFRRRSSASAEPANSGPDEPFDGFAVAHPDDDQLYPHHYRVVAAAAGIRSEEHTSELQSL